MFHASVSQVRFASGFYGTEVGGLGLGPAYTFYWLLSLLHQSRPSSPPFQTRFDPRVLGTVADERGFCQCENATRALRLCEQYCFPLQTFSIMLYSSAESTS